MLTLLTCRDGDWQPKRTKLRPSNNHAAPRVTELMQWAPGPYSLRDITNPAGIAAPCFANNFFTLSSQPRFLLWSTQKDGQRWWESAKRSRYNWE